MGQRLYRIIRGEQPTVNDFKSHKAIGKPLHDVRWHREWESGISTFDTLDYAIGRARTLRFKIGEWVVALQLPDDESVEARQTGENPIISPSMEPPKFCCPWLSADQSQREAGLKNERRL